MGDCQLFQPCLDGWTHPIAESVHCRDWKGHSPEDLLWTSVIEVHRHIVLPREPHRTSEHGERDLRQRLRFALNLRHPPEHPVVLQALWRGPSGDRILVRVPGVRVDPLGSSSGMRTVPSLTPPVGFGGVHNGSGGGQREPPGHAAQQRHALPRYPHSRLSAALRDISDPPHPGMHWLIVEAARGHHQHGAVAVQVGPVRMVRASVSFHLPEDPRKWTVHSPKSSLFNFESLSSRSYSLQPDRLPSAPSLVPRRTCAWWSPGRGNDIWSGSPRRCPVHAGPSPFR